MRRDGGRPEGRAERAGRVGACRARARAARRPSSRLRPPRRHARRLRRLGAAALLDRLGAAGRASPRGSRWRGSSPAPSTTSSASER